MGFDEFSKEVLDAVRERADGKFSAWIEKNRMNNGGERTGIMIQADGRRVSPYIYLEPYYEKHKNGGMSIEEIADQFYNALDGAEDMESAIDIESFLNWEKIKGNIRAKLVNAGMNGEFLKECPNRGYLDLAVLYYVRIGGFPNGAATILVRNTQLEIWGMTENDLYEAAMENMQKGDEVQMMSMKNVLMENLSGWDPQDEKSPAGGLMPEMSILTNKDRLYGASAILDGRIVKDFSENYGRDVMILPCSIHELILFPVSENEDFNILAQMVANINMTELSAEERLSDHIYKYEKESGEIRIVA